MMNVWKLIREKWQLASIIFIALIGTLPFLRNMRDGYISDDWILALNAARSTQTISSSFLTNNLGTVAGGAYRPLFSLFWRLGQLLGGNPWPLHILQLLFHLGSIVLIILIGQKIFGEKKYIGFIAGLFFALFPNHAEPVIWLATSADPMGTFFYLLSFLAYLYARRSEKYFWSLIVIAWVAAFAAFLSKEMMATLPFIIIFWELLQINKTYTRKEFVRAGIIVLPFFLLCGVYLILRLRATGILFGYYGAPKIKIDPFVAMHSTVTIFVSHFFSGDLRKNWVPILNKHNVVGGIILITGIGALFQRRLLRVSKKLLFLVGAFLLSIGPVLQFGINVIPGRVTDEGERYAYLPSVFVALLLGWFIASIYEELTSQWRKYFVAGIVVLSIFLATQLIVKTERWHEAAKSTAKILDSWHTVYGNTSADGVVIIGLPDNDRGVYLLRNGFGEALALQFKLDPSMIITPLRTVDSLHRSFEMHRVGDTFTYSTQSGRNIVGDPFFTVADYSATLVNPIDAKFPLSYRYFAREATLTFSPSFLKTNSKRTIAVMAWNGAGWDRLDLK